MGRVVGQIGEQGLVDVENPDVLAIAGNLHRLGERQRVVGRELRVRPVPVAGHVILYPLHAPVWNRHPDSGVVGLDGESPAITEEDIVSGELGGAAAIRRDSDEGIGKGARNEGEREGEEEKAAGIHGRKPRKPFDFEGAFWVWIEKRIGREYRLGVGCWVWDGYGINTVGDDRAVHINRGYYKKEEMFDNDNVTHVPFTGNELRNQWCNVEDVHQSSYVDWIFFLDHFLPTQLQIFLKKKISL